MVRSGNMQSTLRIVVLSALAAFFSPLVFFSIVVLRRAERRFNVHARVWNKRLQHEIARWS
jgi:hypothetical protein